MTKIDYPKKTISESKLIEYEPGTAFPGDIGLTVPESTQAWPSPLRAKEGSPNVLFWIVDDVGY